jgi:hypothetical protein
MLFNDHSDLTGKHAFLSPSNYHWLGYNDQKLEARFISAMAARKGTELHQFAHDAIRLSIPLPDEPKTLNMYVNDGIEFRMKVEQPLYYSPNCFGHSDTIAFWDEFLRIHDLKTGISATSEKQLEVYAAIFCLEYMISPFDIGIELRIYQHDEVRVYQPYGDQIQFIMDKIVDFDEQIKNLRGESW